MSADFPDRDGEQAELIILNKSDLTEHSDWKGLRRIADFVRDGRRLRRTGRETGDLVELGPCHVALLTQSPTGQHQVLDALVAAECDLDCVLRRDIRTQPHVGEQADALDELWAWSFGPCVSRDPDR